MLLAVFAVATGFQESAAPTPTTELVSSVRTVAPGKPFTVALHMKLPAHWHNYYSNPGESGAPTTIAWTLPAGYKAGPIQWPLPHRIVFGGVPMYGYEGDVWLSSLITPDGATPGKTAEIKAKASWLLCADICVPQSAELKLNLPVAKSQVMNGNPGLRAAIKELPRRALPWSISAVVADKAIRLTVQDRFGKVAGVTFFPADPNSFTADTPKFSAVSHGFQLVVPLSRYSSKPPQRLTGILSFPATHQAYWVDTPVVS